MEADVRASFEKKIEDLNKAVTSMEAERLEMVEKLSQAKQRGVMLIKVNKLFKN